MPHEEVEAVFSQHCTKCGEPSMTRVCLPCRRKDPGCPSCSEGAPSWAPAQDSALVQAALRVFSTGATRDQTEGKLDYDGFLSPRVLRRFAEYMHKHRIQSDGQLRASDNWQKGIPSEEYMKSAWRHFMAWWFLHRTHSPNVNELQEALCALMFNTMGYLHELLKAKP